MPNIESLEPKDACEKQNRATLTGLSLPVGVFFMVCVLVIPALVPMPHATIPKTREPHDGTHQLESIQGTISAPRELKAQGKRVGRLGKLFGGGDDDDNGGIMGLIRLIIIIFTILTQIVFGCVYKAKVVNNVPVLPGTVTTPHGRSDFSIGVFGCFTDCHLCLHSGCCYACRAAHSLHVLDLANYWLMMIAYSFLWCCFGPFCRMRVREKVGLPPNPVMDILCGLFCPCCSVGQEAYEVDEATKVNVACCCQLIVNASPQSAYATSTPTVGQPIEVIGGVHK